MLIKPNAKEIARADTDGLTVVVRPASEGGYNVFLVGAKDNGFVWWSNHVDNKYEIRREIAESLRMANKCAIGEQMSRKSRDRNFYSTKKCSGWI